MFSNSNRKHILQIFATACVLVIIGSVTVFAEETRYRARWGGLTDFAEQTGKFKAWCYHGNDCYHQGTHYCGFWRSGWEVGYKKSNGFGRLPTKGLITCHVQRLENGTWVNLNHNSPEYRGAPDCSIAADGVTGKSCPRRWGETRRVW